MHTNSTTSNPFGLDDDELEVTGAVDLEVCDGYERVWEKMSFVDEVYEFERDALNAEWEAVWYGD